MAMILKPISQRMTAKAHGILMTALSGFNWDDVEVVFPYKNPQSLEASAQWERLAPLLVQLQQ